LCHDARLSEICKGLAIAVTLQLIRYTTHPDGVDWPRLIVDLEADRFHNGRTPAELERSFRNSAVVALAWVGDRVIGTARALSDGVCNTYVVDVWTQSGYRRRGVARRLMKMIEAAVPGQHVYLFTHDAAALYESLGYQRDGIGYAKVIGRWLGRDVSRPPKVEE
jgi:predicted GNAT family acetyltransferase